VRTVSGRTDRVVIVGAGLGGLSAALRLAGAGREVVLVERDPLPGGRAGRIDIGGYQIDTGPTVLTMPSLVADALACVDEHVDDWLDLRRVDPAYRAFFPDGSQLDVIADVDRMSAEVAALCGPREADGYRRYADYARRLFELERHAFMDRNLDSPLSLLTPALARLVAMGGLGRLAPKVGSFMRDPRLRRVFSFQALYAGLSPYDARALYCAISYLDAVAGVWFPVGGMHAVPAALAGAAQKHGVDLRLGAEVVRVERRGARATAVQTADGERIAADVVVLNTDLATTWRLLGLSPRPLHWAPSCLLVVVGTDAHYPKAAHHNLHFGAAWRRTLRELSQGRLLSDPSLLVSIPTATDPALAPPRRSLLATVALVPNLHTPLDWSTLASRYRDEVLARLEQFGYVGLADAVQVEHVMTPVDWAGQGLAAGTPFSATHQFSQTGPFRTGNLPLDNVVLAGCGTHPGVGVPTALMSGRLAAERVVGPGVR